MCVHMYIFEIVRVVEIAMKKRRIHQYAHKDGREFKKNPNDLQTNFNKKTTELINAFPIVNCAIERK